MGASARAAGIYVRISEDRLGEGLGVQRQLLECTALVQRRGWRPVATYTDNDVSAYGTRRRPGYESMLAALRAGHVNAIVVWHVDRLTRKPYELEQFILLADQVGAELATVQGEIDLGTPGGRLFARQLGAFARYEQEHKSERQRAANRQRAQSGKPWGSGLRCFGYSADGTEVREDEALVIKQMSVRLLGGESLRSLLGWLNDAGVKTTTGRPWQATSARRLLMNPRLVGKRVYRGEVVAEGEWPAVLTPEDQAQLTALFTDPQRQRNPNPASRLRRYLLTGGLLVCGLCGTQLSSQPSNSGKRGYVCRSTAPQSGCGRIRIAAEPIELEVAVRVLTRMASPKVRARLGAASSTAEDGSLLVEQIATLEGRLAQLGRDYADGEIGRTEFHAARGRLSERIDEARRAVVAASRLDDLPAADPEKLAVWWEEASLERRRELVQVVLDHIVVGPATRRGPSGLDEDRLQWIWH